MAVKKPTSSSDRSLRICHLADIHLGYRRFNRLTRQGFNQREVDVSIAFRESVDRCLALKPQAVIIAGDLFHSVRPSNAILAFAFREVRRLVTELKGPVVIVAGNHESPRRSDTGSPLRVLAEIPGVFIAEREAERFAFPDLELAVMCVPHAALENLAAIELRADDRYRWNVLAAHGQIGTRAITDFGGLEVPLDALSPHEWDYIALGHIHSRLDLTLTASYCGSIEHTGANIWAGMREPKGFLSVELPGAEKTFHALTSPREVYVLPTIYCEGKAPEEVMSSLEERLADVPGGLEGKLVKIELADCGRQLFQSLDHRALRSLRQTALHLQIDPRPPIELGRSSPLQTAKRGSLVAEVEKFCRGWSKGAGENDALWNVVHSYIRRVEEEDEARISGA